MIFKLIPNIFESNLKIFSVNNENLKDFIKDKQKIIYHYTSAEALKDILSAKKNFTSDRDPRKEYGTIWCTDYNFLNDKTEGKAFFEDIIVPLKKENSILDKILSKKNIDKPQLMYADFEYYGDNEKGEPIVDEKYNEYDWFLTSFSTDCDSLELWQYYTKNNHSKGYNIGFNLYDFLKINVNMFMPEEIYSGEVVYGDKKNKDMQKQDVLEMIDIYQKNISTENSFHLEEDFYMVLCIKSLFYKKECFKNEKEYRILVKREKNNSKYRAVNGILTPYQNIYFSRETIKQITVSPTADPDDLSVLGIRKFLQDNCYGTYDKQTGYGVKVAKSTIPVRY